MDTRLRLKIDFCFHLSSGTVVAPIALVAFVALKIGKGMSALLTTKDAVEFLDELHELSLVMLNLNQGAQLANTIPLAVVHRRFGHLSFFECDRAVLQPWGGLVCSISNVGRLIVWLRRVRERLLAWQRWKKRRASFLADLHEVSMKHFARFVGPEFR
jgi:hypothetical protein